jgi:hypothetical protein
VAARVSSAGAAGKCRASPEIEHFHPAGRHDHHVAGLDVTMHEAGLVRSRQRIRDLRCIVEDAIDRQSARLDRRRERRALDVLHDQKLDIAAPAQFVDGDDVGMVEARRGPGLTQDARRCFGVNDGVDGQDLDGDDAAEDGVAGTVYGAHAALTELGLDLVVAQRRTSHWWNESVYRPKNDSS